MQQGRCHSAWRCKRAGAQGRRSTGGASEVTCEASGIFASFPIHSDTGENRGTAWHEVGHRR